MQVSRKWLVVLVLTLVVVAVYVEGQWEGATEGFFLRDGDLFGWDEEQGALVLVDDVPLAFENQRLVGWEIIEARCMG